MSTQSDEITVVEVPTTPRPSKTPLANVSQTWIEQGAWCAFAQHAVATCSAGCGKRSSVVLARSEDYEYVRQVALDHRRLEPTHRVVFEVTQRTTITTPLDGG